MTERLIQFATLNVVQDFRGQLEYLLFLASTMGHGTSMLHQFAPVSTMTVNSKEKRNMSDSVVR